MEKRFLLKDIFFMIAVLGVLLVSTFAVDNSAIFSSKWMADINDDTKICDLNIPGTHDSATSKLPIVTNLWLRCQSSDINKQLLRGIRYFDLRVDDKGILNHNGVDCRKGIFGKLYFINVVKDIEAFLENNPTESVILQIKSEGAENSCDSYVNHVLSLSEHFYSPGNKDLSSLTLGDIRGKFIVFSRDAGVDGYKFSRWPDNKTFSSRLGDSAVYVQDEYDVGKDYKTKIEKIKDFYEVVWSGDSKKNSILINFISFKGRPSKNANKIKPFITEYLSENCNKRLGIVMFDFPSDENIKNVYKNGHLARK